MTDFIDLEHLEPYDGTVDFIRLSFKRWRLDWVIKTAKILQDKGYKVFINPVNNNVCSDKEYIEVLEKVNKLHPYGFSIVDTFGVMRLRDLSHRYYLVEHNLLPDINIGFHFHENLGLAYSLAQHAIDIANPKRGIIIDSSLLGMGRVSGNLHTEQIMDCAHTIMGLADTVLIQKYTSAFGYAGYLTRIPVPGDNLAQGDGGRMFILLPCSHQYLLVADYRKVCIRFLFRIRREDFIPNVFLIPCDERN